MADTDANSPILRYNLVSSVVEYFQGSDYYPIGTSIVVPTLGLPVVVAIAGTGTVTPNAAVASEFTMTVSGAVTLNGPSNPTNGQKVIFRILNDGSHAITLATGAGNFRFGTTITSYTNSVSLTDYLGAIYNGPANRWDLVALVQGF